MLCLIIIFISLLSIITISTSHSSKSNHLSAAVSSHLEALGELYYENQKVERTKTWDEMLTHVGANFPCIRGVIPIGLNTPDSIEDGHKFGCGIFDISKKPIVYSFGSHRQQDFEYSMLELRPDAEIHTFEIVADMLPPLETRKNKFYNYGLGYDHTNNILKTFKDIMIMLNHTYVDVVKMDIEGSEWPFVHKEGDVIERIGQLMIEVHIAVSQSPSIPSIRDYPGKDMRYFVSKLEERNLRLFHQEVNHEYPDLCTEQSYIQKDWGRWDAKKEEFKPFSKYQYPFRKR